MWSNAETGLIALSFQFGELLLYFFADLAINISFQDGAVVEVTLYHFIDFGELLLPLL